MEICFEFRIVWSDVDVVQIAILGWDGAFAGLVEVYAAHGELKEVAAQLSGFPHNPGDVREIALGTFERNFAGGGLRMRFHCVDSSGHAFVEAAMDANFKNGGTIQSAVLAMPFEPAALDVFVQELKDLESVRGDVARLRGIGNPCYGAE